MHSSIEEGVDLVGQSCHVYTPKRAEEQFKINPGPKWSICDFSWRRNTKFDYVFEWNGDDGHIHRQRSSVYKVGNV